MDTENLEKLIDVFAQRIYGTAFDLMQADPHQWNERGCSTCEAISAIIKKPFGCIFM